MGNQGNMYHFNQKSHFFHSVKRAVKVSDIFAIPLPINMKRKEKYQSKLSGAVSLLIIGFFVFVAVYTSLSYYYGGSGTYINQEQYSITPVISFYFFRKEYIIYFSSSK